MKENCIAIILARAGSKGLPGKNMKLLHGKPLIRWSIESLQKSCLRNSFLLSTDSPEIVSYSKQLGVYCPFIRPDYLSSDTATSIDAIEHALKFLKHAEKQYENIMLIEPTSPLRTHQDIDDALSLFYDSGATGLVSVASAEDRHSSFLFECDDELRLKSINTEGFKVLRRQDLTKQYYLDGTIYISNTEELLRQRSFVTQNTIGFKVPKWKAAEIDDIWDFVHVEALMRHLNY
jgi:CMP-N,N'-diacetyllegionaminic acid synthase